MKTIQALILLLIMAVGYSQNSPDNNKAVTTYQEYNFLTKTFGNSDQEQMLEGYEFQDFHELTVDKYNFNYRRFVESETGLTKAVSIVVTKIKKKDDKVRYLCMPFNNKALFELYMNDSETLGITMAYALNTINNVMLAELIDDRYNGQN